MQALLLESLPYASFLAGVDTDLPNDPVVCKGGIVSDLQHLPEDCCHVHLWDQPEEVHHHYHPAAADTGAVLAAAAVVDAAALVAAAVVVGAAAVLVMIPSMTIQNWMERLWSLQHSLQGRLLLLREIHLYSKRFS